MRVFRAHRVLARMPIVAALLLGPWSMGLVAAQNAQESSTTSTNPHLAELDYLLGDWRVRTFTREAPSGQWTETAVASWYRARLLRDGRSILAEFYASETDDFYGVHLISREAEGRFVHWYLNSKAERRLEFSGHREPNAYHLTRPGGYGGGDFLYRETDSEIRADSFAKEIFRSDDHGRTWMQQDYRFEFERVESNSDV